MAVGEYGYGDKFCGTRVSILRKFAEKYCNVSLDDVANLLQNELHEGSFAAFVLLVEKFTFCRNRCHKFILKIFVILIIGILWMLPYRKFVEPIA
jgi:hypothetical protein